MPKNKQAYEITLETDHMDFVTWAKDKYDIPDESKVLRIVMDYVISNRDLQENIFTYTRCRRCE